MPIRTLMFGRISRGVQVALLAGLTGAACGNDKPVEVTGIQVGRTRNSDKSIAVQTTDFKPADTIYAAVIVEGRGTAKVEAHWIMPGGMTSDADQSVTSRDREVSGFELRSAGGFPPGKYLLEIRLNGTPVGTKEMRVR